MKRSHIPLFLALLIAQSTHLTAADPGWWAARGVTTTASPSNKSPATIGQAKHMVAMALAEIQSPRLNTNVVQGLRADVAAVVGLDIPNTPEGFERQRRVLLVGQLKALAAPFYQRLHNSYRGWLETQLILNQTKDTYDSTNFYPWSSNIADDSNMAVATLGQLKAVFSLRFETLPALPFYQDDDGMDDTWELTYGLDPSSAGDAASDADFDGLSNLAEFQAGMNPNNIDGDGDLLPDGWEVFYRLDPKSPLGVNGANGNPDGDDFSNFKEYVFGFNPQVRSPALADDTDSDGYNDNVDYYPFDPLIWQAPAGSNVVGVPVVTLLSPPDAVLAP